MMVKFRAKHVCTPGARRVKTQAWKRQVNKVKVVAVEKLPLDYVPEVKVKKKKTINPDDYKLRIDGVTQEAVAKSTRMSNRSDIPRITITCGGYQAVKKGGEAAYQEAIKIVTDAGIPLYQK